MTLTNAKEVRSNWLKGPFMWSFDSAENEWYSLRWEGNWTIANACVSFFAVRGLKYENVCDWIRFLFYSLDSLSTFIYLVFLECTESYFIGRNEVLIYFCLIRNMGASRNCSLKMKFLFLRNVYLNNIINAFGFSSGGWKLIISKYNVPSQK